MKKRTALICTAVLFSTVATAQITIKTRVEIRPTNTPRIQQSVAEAADVTLPPINISDFSLNSCGGFMSPFDNIYNDQVFVPRVGGTIELAYDNYATFSGGMAGAGGFDLAYDTLLVIGRYGQVKYCFALIDLVDSQTWNTYGGNVKSYV
jgi:hypothetical protein